MALRPFARSLARRPLYVSLDKDVLTAEEAVVNWDSGHLRLAEVTEVLGAFVAAARGDVVGVDVPGAPRWTGEMGAGRDA